MYYTRGVACRGTVNGFLQKSYISRDTVPLNLQYTNLLGVNLNNYVFLFFDGVRVTESVMLEENLYLYFASSNCLKITKIREVSL